MPLSPPILREFYDQYVKAIESDCASLFVGAGLSRAAGYVDWRELLSEIANDLHLEIDRETDLLAVAQYHYNSRRSRGRLNQKLIEEFTQDAVLTKNHRLIAGLPVKNVWTTNYDKLLEHAYTEARKRVDVKVAQEHLAYTRPRANVTLYKMHGDIDSPSNAVLLRDDYELYGETHGLFTTQLRGELVSHTFLFLGFSFTDPNIEHILGRLRVRLGQHNRSHYCIMRRIQRPSRLSGRAKADFEYEERKLELRVADLSRYGINTILIDDYSEITAILEELSRRTHLKDVFVSGSASECGLRGFEGINSLARQLGHELIGGGYRVTTGLGLGIGGSVMVGAMEAVNQDESLLMQDRLILRPFPKEVPTGMSRQEFTKAYRTEFIERCGSVVFLSGNKRDPDGNIVVADGMLQEFEICKQLGKHPIPVGSTGYASEIIWREVTQDLGHYFGRFPVEAHFNTLGDPTKSNEDIVHAVLSIIRTVSKA
jgi:hypothetical protein